MLFRKKKLDIGSLYNDVLNKDKMERYCLFILGVYIYALAFNLFLAPYDIVSGGATGLSLIIKDLFGINSSIFVFVFSLITLVIGGFILGWDMAFKTLIGIILLPLFMSATEIFNSIVDLSGANILLLMIYGGVLTGFANGLILKTGFSVGGFQTIYQVLYKLFNIGISKSNMVINFFVILMGSYVFGIPNAFYAIVTLYVSSLITDKVLLGISDSKAFYIVTDKEGEVSTFIMEKLDHAVTLIDVKGGVSSDKKKMVLTVIPTREYFLVKEVVSKLDKNAFFLITDAYEVQGGL